VKTDSDSLIFFLQEEDQKTLCRWHGTSWVESLRLRLY
jgi:hypothetical protein